MTSLFYARSHGFLGTDGFARRIWVDLIQYRILAVFLCTLCSKNRNRCVTSRQSLWATNCAAQRGNVVTKLTRICVWTPGEVNNPSHRSSIPPRTLVKYYTMVKRSLVYDRRRSDCGGFSRSFSTIATITDVTVDFN